MMKTANINRRNNRSNDVQVALSFQLAATARRANFPAIVLADELGLVIAKRGDTVICEQMAAMAPSLATRKKTFHGIVNFGGETMRLSVAPITIGGALFYLCAKEGDRQEITRELFTGGLGVSRILA